MINTIMYPNVSRIPANQDSQLNKVSPKSAELKGEFDAAFESALKENSVRDKILSPSKDLSISQNAIKFSAHANQRLKDRMINFSPEMLGKISDAVTKADSKGVQDALILTDHAALIVNIPNRTVVTAMDKNSLNGNIFTNVDGAVII